MSSAAPSTPTTRVSEADFDMDVDGDTTASTAVPSSPVLSDLGLSKKTISIIGDNAFDASKRVEKEHELEEHKPDLQERLERLNILLEKSSVYTSLLGERMNQLAQIQSRPRDSTASNLSQTSGLRGQKGRGRKREPACRPDHLSKSKTGSKRTRPETIGDDDDVDGNVKRLKLEDGGSTTHDNQESLPSFEQPEAITGAKLKDYQLVGVQWLTSLYANGVNGILADEMGLGKTLQTIAFLANVRQLSGVKPVLIVCPLSVLHNWADEFEKFAPSIPVCMYHGTPAERAELRRSKMMWHEEDPSSNDTSSVLAVKKQTVTRRLTRSGKKSTRESKRHSSPSNETASRRRSIRLKTEMPSGRFKANEHHSEDDADQTNEESYIPNDEIDAETDTLEKHSVTDISDGVLEDEAHNSTDSKRANDTFPIILTTYEMIIKDRQHLSKYKWNFIVVDEGHRLKNMDCKLIQEIKKYDSANRLILTGTPLHNNLAELWSLLNFILPDIFTDLYSFQEWFNLPSLQGALPNEQSTHVISKLHGILKPFLLRRMKVDVECSLPPKKEYVLYAPLSETQREVYDAVLTGVLRNYLINGKLGGNIKKGQAKLEVEGRRFRKRVNYDVDGEDDEWFDKLERGEFDVQSAHEEQLRMSRQFQHKHTVKKVNSMKLQNTVMQLRKVCSHPFLFDWPTDPVTRDPVVNEQLVNASGKMMILDRLLSELFNRGHKVLLFSQFTTMLDIIEEWADSFKSWPTCRIDGSTGPLERRAEMNRFQKSGDGPESPRLFLLSTRAGGLGINLTAADTVIFYDQDWNPQMDIQAQDRAHRIGQTKPVLIFRLVSAHTVETKIMQRANEKRQLEALVIAKGKFRMPGSTSRGKGESIVETAASLLKLEGEKIEVVSSSDVGKSKIISDSDLDKLLDRSPDVFSDRGKGWTSGAKVVQGGPSSTGDVAFEVFQAPVDQCNHSLAAMMGEELE